MHQPEHNNQVTKTETNAQTNAATTTKQNPQPKANTQPKQLRSLYKPQTTNPQTTILKPQQAIYNHNPSKYQKSTKSNTKPNHHESQNKPRNTLNHIQHTPKELTINKHPKANQATKTTTPNRKPNHLSRQLGNKSPQTTNHPTTKTNKNKFCSPSRKPPKHQITQPKANNATHTKPNRTTNQISLPGHTNNTPKTDKQT